MSGFRKAKGEQAFLKLGIYGSAGSGKTFTSLLIGEGLANVSGKKIAFVDTERGSDFYCQEVKERKIHPKAFDFDALYTKSITEILSEIKKIDTSKYGVVVIDSITHVWEAAKQSFEGKLTKIGTIPMQAWGKIKKPYKDLMNHLLSLDAHVIICGRQGTDFAEDEETGELKNMGYKMKAEGETPYEPHILLRLESVKGKNVDSYPIVHVEKDRTGILAGKAIEYPTFDNIAKPLLGVLGNKQAKVEENDVTASKDAEKLAEDEMNKEAKSNELLEWFTARFKIANSLEAVEAIGKEITKETKSQMLAADTATLREEYLRAAAKYKSH